MKKIFKYFTIVFTVLLAAHSSPISAQNGAVVSGNIFQAPRTTRAGAVPTPARGMIIYDTLVNHYYGRTNIGWSPLDSGAVASASGMDTAYTRNDSIFGVKNGEEFYIYTSPTPASNQPLTFDDSDFTSPFSYDGSSTQNVKINENKYALKSDLNSDSTQALYVVDTISNYPKCGDIDGNSYLVGVSPPAKYYCAPDSLDNPFYGHKNEPVRNIGGVYNFYTPVVGDHLDVTNHKTSGSYRYGADSTWSLLPKFDRSDGNRDNFAPKFGSFNNKDAYIITHNNDVMKFSKNGDIYVYTVDNSAGGPGHLDLTSAKKLIWVPDTLLAGVDPIVIDSIGRITIRKSWLDSLYAGGSSGSGISKLGSPAYGLTRINDSTYIADTTILTSQTRLTNSLALKLNISDTAAMLSSYTAKINKNIDSLAAHNTRILNEAVARDNADIKTLGVTGTTTKTITLTKGDASTISGTFTDDGGSGSSGTSVTEKMTFKRPGEYYALHGLNNSTGAFTTLSAGDSSAALSDYLQIFGDTTYIISVNTGYPNITIYGWWYDASHTAISEIRSNSLIGTKLNWYEVKAPTNAKFLVVYVKYGGQDFDNALVIKSKYTVTYTNPILLSAFSGTSRQKLQAALDFQHFTQSGWVKNDDNITIDSTMIWRSGTRLENNGTITLDSLSKTNIARSESAEDPANLLHRATVDIKVWGKGIFQGPKSAWGGDYATGVGKQIWRGVGIYIPNVFGFNMKDVTIRNTARWAFSADQSRYGVIDNVSFLQDSSRANQDGIDFRTASHDWMVTNCRFHNQDDATANTNLLLGSDSFEVYGTTAILEPYKPNTDIYNIFYDHLINDTSGIFGFLSPQQFKSGHLVLPADGKKVHHIYYSNLSGWQQILIAPTFFQYWISAPATVNDVYEIHVNNSAGAKIYLGTPIKNSSFIGIADKDIWGNDNCVIPNGSLHITRQFGNYKNYYRDSVGGTPAVDWDIKPNGKTYNLSPYIGFGTATPAYQVDVLGKIRVSDTAKLALLKMDSTQTTPITKILFSNLYPAGVGGGTYAGYFQANANGYNSTGGVSELVKSRINFQGSIGSTSGIFTEFLDSTIALGAWKQTAILTSDGKMGLGIRTQGTLPTNYLDGSYNVAGAPAWYAQNNNSGSTSSMSIGAKNNAGGSIELRAESNTFVAGFSSVGVLFTTGDLTKMLVNAPSAFDVYVGSLGSYPTPSLHIGTGNRLVLNSATDDGANQLQVNGTAKISTINASTSTADPILVSNSGVIKSATNFERVMASGDVSAQTTSQNITTYTTGAADSTFEVTGRIEVTGSPTGTVALAVTYTDAISGGSVTKTFYDVSAGTFAATVATVGAAQFYPIAEIKVKASTTITVAATVVGGIQYYAGATIIKIR